MYISTIILASKVAFMVQLAGCNMFTVSWQMTHLPLCSFPWILGTLLSPVLHLLWRITSFKPSSSPHPSTQKNFLLLNSVRKAFQSRSQQIITYPLLPWKACALSMWFWVFLPLGKQSHLVTAWQCLRQSVITGSPSV